MTNAEASLNTKKALADALKQLMHRKPFSKITVSELIRECNVNRKTFYYHFEDIYALLKWTIEQESIAIVRRRDWETDYEEMISFVYDYVQNNAFLPGCAYDSLGRDTLKQFFLHDFEAIVSKIIETAEDTCHVSTAPHFRQFLCSLYTEGFASILINLFQNPDLYTKENLIGYLTLIIHTSIPAVLSATQPD